jgi:hypothetical protein
MNRAENGTEACVGRLLAFGISVFRLGSSAIDRDGINALPTKGMG